ncbi:aminoglycoside phosphotransferase family protein [Paenibacillus doosanensis]|uniref:Phosphotransferase enzyme family protein n=1 Tax=Paenibacillus konkukensis TaxID=2020716 RepID=A0ABY4RJG9_9BACL|nr:MULTISPECIES: phosphotransferase [Paenibacillus]MCS7463925.1 aminoglycoside phosphotransferase family protein [Paenibacillus doosanensis]UQZ82260.1 Phosphotransferase enzyme family protein [Paenibacillus konkukensis]
MTATLNISQERLYRYVRKLIGHDSITLGEWSCSRHGWQASNIVTGGLYRVEGTALAQDRPIRWSMIVKIVVPAAGSQGPAHYNYWKREILAYQSGLLEKLPSVIRAPRCYGVEEKEDKTVWIWMEEVSDYYKGQWSGKQYEDVARCLGRFNGAYGSVEALPSAPWLCSNWLSSWVEECDKYDNGIARKQEVWAHPSVKELFPSDTFRRYSEFCRMRSRLLDGLSRLPKVFTHNDAWRPNLYLQEDGTVAAIDWAFAGIAGVGEELGRYYGLCLHSGLGASFDMAELAEKFLQRYYEGLEDAGWNGGLRQVRFGFLTAAGIRCGMLIPKLMDKALQGDRDESESLLNQIEAALQLLGMAEEAAALLGNLALEEGGRSD